jgi:phosphatidylserine/phosphatidylglycerophosphate/cardiolipin synthase-like enzyme
MQQRKPAAHMPSGSHIPAPVTSSYPVRDGNLVRPLIDAVPAFRRICEAIDEAQRSIWVAVTFLSPDFQMPDGRGTIFDVLDRAAGRGLDVRLLIWRPEPEMYGWGKVFPGLPADRALLQSRGSLFRVRWDRGHPGFAQHQKAWLIDAGLPAETAFVGGINLTAATQNVPGHPGEGQIHDVYVEIAGPAASDVHHNVVQRWNEASERSAADGVWTPDGIDDDLAFPIVASAARGSSRVQIQRNIHAGRYHDSSPAPEGRFFPIGGGEYTIRDQYLLAIDAARTSVYIENQAVPIPVVATRLQRALERGVHIALLMPGVPDPAIQAARKASTHRDLFDCLATLGRHERFTLAGIAGLDERSSRRDVYVHDKIMIVDDAWATIGSCNLHTGSLSGQSELNASIWDPKVAHALRVELFSEHLDIDTTHMDDRAALDRFRRVARENRRRRDVGDNDWQGLAFTIDPETYGL